MACELGMNGGSAVGRPVIDIRPTFCNEVILRTIPSSSGECAALEHDVYVCGWSKSDEGFELWLKSRPEIRARGRTYEAAEKALIDAIHDRGGAMQAVMEFDPPLPRPEFDDKYSTPVLYLVTGDEEFQIDKPPYTPFEDVPPDLTGEELRIAFARARSARVEWEHAWTDGFFTAPVCRECRAPQAGRSERTLVLAHGSSFDGGWVSIGKASIQIFSQAFLDLLTEEEKHRIEFRKVNRAGKAGKMFYELLGPSGPPYVAVAGLKFSGWTCDSCGDRNFGYWNNNSDIRHFIAFGDLPRPLPDVFTVGSVPNVSLCVTAERWSEMVGQRGTRGFVSFPVGVVPDNEVERTPHLETFQELQRRANNRRQP
jgi:hypothetical protein